MFKKNKNQQPLERRRPPSTDTKTPPAFSYRAARSSQAGNIGRRLPSEPAESRHRGEKRSKLHHLGVAMISLVVLASAVYATTLSTTPKIVALGHAASSPFLQKNSVYSQAAEVLLRKSPSSRNKITINAQAIAAEMEQQFPELTDVSVALPLVGHHPTIYIQPTGAAFILATAGHGSFLVDDSGRALVNVNQVPSLVRLRLPVVQDQSGLAVSRGAAVLPATSVSFIKTVIGQLGAKQVALTGLVLPASASELDVQVRDGGHSYRVKFNTQTNNARQQVGTYLAVRQKLQAGNTAPASYVDVRVAGRAYYK